MARCEVVEEINPVSLLGPQGTAILAFLDRLAGLTAADFDLSTVSVPQPAPQKRTLPWRKPERSDLPEPPPAALTQAVGLVKADGLGAAHAAVAGRHTRDLMDAAVKNLHSPFPFELRIPYDALRERAQASAYAAATALLARHLLDAETYATLTADINAVCAIAL